MEDAGLDKAEKEGEGDGKKEGKKVKFSQRDQVSDEENARSVYNLYTRPRIIVLK